MNIEQIGETLSSLYIIIWVIMSWYYFKTGDATDPDTGEVTMTTKGVFFGGLWLFGFLSATVSSIYNVMTSYHSFFSGFTQSIFLLLTYFLVYSSGIVLWMYLNKRLKKDNEFDDGIDDYE